MLRRLMAGPGSLRATVLPCLLAASLGTGLLAAGTIAPLAPEGESIWHRQPKRFWEDLYVAIGLHLHGEFPVSTKAVARARDEQGAIHYVERHDDVSRPAERLGIRPWEPWRTVPVKRLIQRPVSVFPRFDDSGRPLFLGLLFNLLGGVSPFLMFWMGALLVAPILGWLAWELVVSGHRAAAIALSGLLGGWAFLADVLSLTYSTAGFYVAAVVVLAAVAVYGGLGRGVSAGGFWVRVVAAGVAFAVCVLCRGGALMLLPGFAVAFAFAARRVFRRGSGTRRWLWLAATAASLAGFLVPQVLARQGVRLLVTRTFAERGEAEPPPQQHAVWFGIWTGLGDFDRAKGYQWLDAAATAAAVAHGGKPMSAAVYDPANEPILRRLVIDDVRGDPLWYGGILTQRLWATLTQAKLWPWGALGGPSFAPARHLNQGTIDHYYGLTATADVFGVGPARFEVPVVLLLAPAWLLVGIGVAARYRSKDGRGPSVAGYLRSLLPVAVGTLVLPVLVTTAGGVEPQAFVITYLMAAAFVTQEAWLGVRAGRRRVMVVAAGSDVSSPR